MNHRFPQWLLRFCLLLVFSAGATGQDQKPAQADAKRAKIGLVLSGGGARGAAHAGVIKVLHDSQIPIDYIAGVSMGAVVGGLYASGMDPDELVALTRDSDWIDFYTDRPARQGRSFRRKSDGDGFLLDFDIGLHKTGLQFPQGIIQGQKFELALRNMLMPVAGIDDFDQLPIPFRAIATDIANGDMVVLDSGDLPSAIRASISVPGVFIPVEIDERVLVDGGIANNLPVDIVREMGADILIVVNVGFPLLDAEDLDSAFRVTSQMLTVMIKARTEDQLETMTSADILIEPQLGRLGSADFPKVAEAIELGRVAGREMASRLSLLSIPKEQYLAHRTKYAQRRESPPMIDRMIVNNDSRLSPKVLAARITDQVGQTLDVRQLESDIGDIYALDIFESTSYHLEKDGDETNLIISSKGKSWGPNYLRFGVNLESDFAGINNYNVAARLTSTEINPLGGELRVEAQIGSKSQLFGEWYQPINYGSKWFASTTLGIGRTNTVLFQGGNQVAEFLSGDIEFTAGIGREFGHVGEARFSYAALHNSSDILVGPPVDDTFRTEVRGLHISYTHDTLDSLEMPRFGTRFNVDWFGARESLGSDASFDIASVSFIKPMTWGKNTLLNWWEVGTVARGDVGPFELGGLFSLSGYKPEELTGSHAAMLRMLYYRRLGDGQIPILDTPVYIGGSFEVGNVWSDEKDISFGNALTSGTVFVMVDSFVGPVYLAYGVAEGGRESVYLFLGQTF